MRGWLCIDLGITLGEYALIAWLRPFDWRLEFKRYSVSGYVHVGPFMLEWI